MDCPRCTATMSLEPVFEEWFGFARLVGTYFKCPKCGLTMDELPEPEE